MTVTVLVGDIPLEIVIVYVMDETSTSVPAKSLSNVWESLNEVRPFSVTEYCEEERVRG